MNADFAGCGKTDRDVSFVTGHGFIRAENAAKLARALAPEGMPGRSKGFFRTSLTAAVPHTIDIRGQVQSTTRNFQGHPFAYGLAEQLGATRIAGVLS
jgi:hypothetical protein